ncbi:VIT domain-containing protein [Umezawaea sp. Da 62-37]|uniref:VIT domain-containing protein n=1 Tax=Umezawaea sp. Da 62-37 TaxID=3075927 RepID=UPI0028F6EFA9|nr:VIT domain-containing protein [Umezawaea sp. Da 62-37]WNV84688.1 VIT domain-containing protein [Umezawaea sp. Da 62-37]
MTFTTTPMRTAELDRVGQSVDAGVGALRTDRGNLPLDRLDVRATITGLVARVRLTTEFVNPHDTALEATYVFPLPDRAAVTGMTMTADGRTVEAELQERGAARQNYDEAIAAGKRAAIAEEERPDVFTMRVGNILAGERVTVELTMVEPLVYEDDAATFRFPLVVAPRYVPGTPLPGESVGSGHVPDTDRVPDASRITPPVLLPGFPNPVTLSIGVDIDPAGLDLGEVRSSLHTVTGEGNHLSVVPGERADRDFVLRLAYTGHGTSAVCVPDGEEGTYQLTVLPPAAVTAVRPRDVVLLLDRSGSMGGWKMVAARRAAARIVDTLTKDDRFAVVTFDDRVEHPTDLGSGLVAATDRHRYRAVEHLARVEARGGTEFLAPLRDGLSLLAGDDDDRDRVVVLVTDGQVGNEDQILRDIAPLIGRTRIHSVGIDSAVNAGFLGRLAARGAGRCELVESEDRLDKAMEHIQRRIGAPVVTDVTVTADGIALTPDSQAPRHASAIYPGVPLVLAGRYSGTATGSLTVRGRTRDGGDWEAVVPVQRRDEPAIAAQWARAALRDLEDAYVSGKSDLEPTIVATSLKFGVLCRFTAFVAVDARVVTDGTVHRVTQPVESPAGWEAPVALPFAAPQSFGAPQHLFLDMAAPAGAPAPAPSAPPPPMAPRMSAKRSRSAVPMAGGGGGRPGSAGPTFGSAPAVGPDRLAELREIVAVEAGRLHATDSLPDYERRDLLADLASRLDTLLADLVGPVYDPLRALIAQLKAGDDVTALWAEATRVLDAFTGTEPDRKKSFWRR